MRELIQKCVFKCVCPFKATVETRPEQHSRPHAAGLSVKLREQNLELVAESGCRRGSSVLSLRRKETLLASPTRAFQL